MALFVGGVMDGEVRPMGTGERMFKCRVDDGPPPCPRYIYTTYWRSETYLRGIIVNMLLKPPRRLLVFVEEELQKKEDHIPEILQAAEKAREESPKYHAVWESGTAVPRKLA